MEELLGHVTKIERMAEVIHSAIEGGHLEIVKLILKVRSGLEVIKKISCSTQLSLKFFLLINVKNTNKSWHFNIYEQEK